MFTLYCDDSGTHSRSDVAVAACYISTDEQWTEFERNWREVDRREGFGVFHMADFVARREQFSSPDWNEPVKRDRTIKALINIIKTRARVGFSAVVVKSDYDELIVNGGLEHRFGENHYAFVVRMCTALVNRWREKYGRTEPVRYVFDRVSKGKGDIDALFHKLVPGGEDAMRRYGIYDGCWSFENKERAIQLQAADIWAWENYRYMVDTFIPGGIQGTVPKPPRKSYLALIDSPTVVKYHVRASLQDLVNQVPDWAFAGD